MTQLIVADMTAAVQFAVVMVAYGCAIILVLRARSAWWGNVTAPSPVVLGLLAAYFGLLAFRQSYWHMVWTAKSRGLHDVAHSMTNMPLVPLAINSALVVVGASIIAIAGRHHLGRHSAPIVAAAVVAALLIGALMTEVL